MIMAALTMVGCSQNEIMEQNPDADKAIGFGVYTGVQTKGAETTTTTLKGTGVGFGVVALKNDNSSVYMTEKNVTHNGSIWTYTPVAYWPADGTALNFYSFAPYNDADITKTSFETTNPTIGFKIKSSWGNMVDLVAAKNSNAVSNTQVSVQFKHVLTRIAFTANTSVSLESSTTVAVTGLKLLGNTSLSGSCFYETGNYSILNDSWSNEAALSADYSVALAGGSINITNTPVKLLGDNNYLFCIPVTSLQTDKIKVEITYTITSNSVVSTKTETVSIPAGHFAKGTAYTYAFTVNMKGITFTVSEVIDSWSTASSNLDFTV